MDLEEAEIRVCCTEGLGSGVFQHGIGPLNMVQVLAPKFTFQGRCFAKDAWSLWRQHVRNEFVLKFFCSHQERFWSSPTQRCFKTRSRAGSYVAVGREDQNAVCVCATSMSCCFGQDAASLTVSVGILRRGTRYNAAYSTRRHVGVRKFTGST